MIVTRGGKHFVTDLGSANGTLLNGKPVNKEQELRSRDRLSIGGVEFVFESSSPPPEEATRLVPSRSIAPRGRTRITRAHTDQEMQAIEAEDTGRHRVVTDHDVTAPEPLVDAHGQPVAATDSGISTLAETPAVDVPTSPAAQRKSLLGAGSAPSAQHRSLAGAGSAAAQKSLAGAGSAPSSQHKSLAGAGSAQKSLAGAGSAPSAQHKSLAGAGSAQKSLAGAGSAQKSLAGAGSAQKSLAGAGSAPSSQHKSLAGAGSAQKSLAGAGSAQKSLAGAGSARHVAAQPSPSALAAKEPEVALSAAERARERRQARETLGGQLLLWWKELSIAGKSVAGIMMGLVVVGLIVVGVSVFRPAKGNTGPVGPEPSEISISPLPDTFGLGEGVTWKRPDQKSFDFQFISPTRAVVVLHYQAVNIAAKEVSISLNGVEQDWVPVDTATSAEREIELTLDLKLLKRSERNQIAFDNVRNPPGQDSWRIWNVYVEVIPVPELPEEQLLSLARNQANTAQRFYEQKDVGSENLFKAWKNYRSAWITLEAMEAKPDLYYDVRFQLQQTSAELDQQCRKLMLDFQRNLQFRDGDKAIATVQEVMRRFPTTEHRCHNLAIEKAAQYDLPI